MGNWLGFHYSWIFNPLTTITNSHALDLKDKNSLPKNSYFSSYFVMGGHKFERSGHETFLFGDLNDINFFTQAPTLYPYKSPMWFEPVRTLKSLIHIRKDTIKINKINNDAHSDYNLHFIFDTDVKIAITIYFYAKELLYLGKTYYKLLDKSMKSNTSLYGAGCNQVFCQNNFVIDPKKIKKSYDFHNKINSENKTNNSVSSQNISLNRLSRVASTIMHYTFDQLTFVNQVYESKDTYNSKTGDNQPPIYDTEGSSANRNFTPESLSNVSMVGVEEETYFQPRGTDAAHHDGRCAIPKTSSKHSITNKDNKEINAGIPVIVCCTTLETDVRQTHITLASIETSQDGSTGGYVIKPIKQKLISDGLCYLIQEVYGIENKNRKNFDKTQQKPVESHAITPGDDYKSKTQIPKNTFPHLMDTIAKTEDQVSNPNKVSETQTLENIVKFLPEPKDLPLEDDNKSCIPLRIISQPSCGLVVASTSEYQMDGGLEEEEDGELGEGEEETEFILCQSECLICLTKLRNTILLPCRHLCLCNACASVLRYQDGNCPVCRVPFKALLLIEAMRRRKIVSKNYDDKLIKKSAPPKINTKNVGSSHTQISQDILVTDKENPSLLSLKPAIDLNQAVKQSHNVSTAANYELNGDHLYQTIEEGTPLSPTDVSDKPATKMNLIKLVEQDIMADQNLNKIDSNDINTDHDGGSRGVARINMEKLEAIVSAKVMQFETHPSTRQPPPPPISRSTRRPVNASSGNAISTYYSNVASVSEDVLATITPRGFEALPLIVALNGSLPEREDEGIMKRPVIKSPPSVNKIFKSHRRNKTTGGKRLMVRENECSIPPSNMTTNRNCKNDIFDHHISHRNRKHGKLSRYSIENGAIEPSHSAYDTMNRKDYDTTVYTLNNHLYDYIEEEEDRPHIPTNDRTNKHEKHQENCTDAYEKSTIIRPDHVVEMMHQESDIFYDTRDHFFSPPPPPTTTNTTKEPLPYKGWRARRNLLLLRPDSLKNKKIDHARGQQITTPLIKHKSSTTTPSPSKLPVVVMRRFNSLTFPLCAYAPLSPNIFTSSHTSFKHPSPPANVNTHVSCFKDENVALPEIESSNYQFMVEVSSPTASTTPSSSTSSSLSNLAAINDETLRENLR